MSSIESQEEVALQIHDKKISAILHYPSFSFPLATVLICPGFAGTKVGKFSIFLSLTKVLVESGFAVMRFDYRGAGESEGDFAEMTIDSQVEDVLACLNYLKNHPKVNSSAIGLLGRSLGGMIALLAASHFSEIKSLVLWAPVFSASSWKQAFERVSKLPNSFLNQEAKSYLPTNLPQLPGKEFLRQFFAVNLNSSLAKLSSIPLLHIHGQKDQIVTIDHADLYQKASEKYLKTQFIKLASSDHDFSDDKERQLAITETNQWFKNTLLS